MPWPLISVDHAGSLSLSSFFSFFSFFCFLFFHFLFFSFFVLFSFFSPSPYFCPSFFRQDRTNTIFGSYCKVLTNLPHTWIFVSHDTKNQVCDVSVSLRVCSITKEYHMCSWCSSYILGIACPSFFLIST
jgi:hypothetical protein